MTQTARREDPAVEDVRFYLRLWRRWTRAWRAPLGYPSQVAWVRVMPPTPAWESSDMDEEVEGWIMRAVEASVEDLEPRKRASVRLVYLNEVLPAVFHSNRITDQEAKRLTALAEVELVGKFRERGVVVGGR